MKGLEIALKEGPLGDNPSILVLFDPNQVNRDWLSKHSHSFTHCATEAELTEQQLGGNHWDVVIATEGIQRFYSTATPQQLAQFFTWLQNSCRLCVIFPDHVVLDPLANNIGPHMIPEHAGAFTFISEASTHGPSIEVPTIFLSQEFLFDGRGWHRTQEVVPYTIIHDTEINEQELLIRPRTFRTQRGTVIKVQVGSPDFFYSLEVGRELHVLNTLSTPEYQELNFPRVLHSYQGQCVTTLEREHVHGQSLSVGSLANSLDQVFELAQSFANKGLFHNDFRPWNILQCGKDLSMVDFADISNEDQDSRDLPQIVALVGTLAALGQVDTFGMPLRWGDNFDIDLMAISQSYFSENGIQIQRLYRDPWLKLANLPAPPGLSSTMNINELLATVISR